MPIYTCRPDGSVDTCPVTKKAWEARAKMLKDECDFERDYHCLSDNKGIKWEKCIQKTLILEGNCPMYTSDGYLDWKPCNISDLSCPNSSYVSNEVYKYPWCFGDNTPRTEDSRYYVRDGPSVSLIIGIVAPIVLLVLAAAFISLVFGLRRKRRLTTSQRVIEDMIATRPLLKVKSEELKRRIVRKGVALLSKQDVKSIVVIGGIGNLISSTARSILETCAINTKWKSKQYQFPEVPNKVEDKTIMFVYGWFGSWHDDLCSVDDAKEVCQKLSKLLEDEESNIKVIIAMRSDTYSKYQDQLEEYGSSLFCNKINLTNEELLKDHLEYFETLKDNCSNKDCQCHNLTEHMLCHGDDELLGMPLKVEVISKYHDPALLDSYSKDWDIKKAMIAHFEALETNEKPIYEWIMYICLKGHFSRFEAFDKDMVNKIQFNIRLSSFDEHYGQLRRYIRVWFWDPQNVSVNDAQYVFWHPFIYMTAFRYLYNKDKSIVMSYCNIHAILELVRPSSCIRKGTPSSYIEVPADGADVEPLRKRLRKLGLLNKYKDHPLLNDTEENDQ